MTKKFFFTLILFLGFFSFANFSQASVWTISSENSYTTQSGSATLISGIEITGGGGSDVIPVKLRSTSGTLSMSTTTGLTFTGPTSGTTIYFSGTRDNLNNALATLTYNRAGTGSDTLEMSLVEYGEVFFEDNGHLYKFISGNINAITARTQATSLTAYGATGYLATITSQAENDFVAARLQGDGWIAGSDEVSEGVWKWVAGPENGDTFWNGASGGSSPPGQYANWSSGEPNDWSNGNPGEDCVQFYISSTQWNDLNCTGNNLTGYVAEFGAPGDLPEVEARNMSITTVSAPVVSILSPLDNATNISTTANLVITFSQSVSVDTGNILIKKTSDDSLVESVLVSGGKVVGSGSTIITINPSSVLDDMTGYYIEIPNTAFKNTSDAYFAGISSKTTWNFTTGDYNSPVLTEITPIGVAVNNNTPSYTFHTTEAGDITYGGSCSSATNTATLGNNTIVLNYLAFGNYSDCTIVVTDDFDHDSNTLAVSYFSLVVHSGGSSSSPVQTTPENTQITTPEPPKTEVVENTEPNQSNQNQVIQNTYISPIDKNTKFCPGFTKYLRKGSKSNDKNEVILWQSFLNEFYDANLLVDGIYGNQTEKAIKEFQNKYKEYILLPWNLKAPTGYTYQTTQSYANKILGCNVGSISLDNGKTINF